MWLVVGFKLNVSFDARQILMDLRVSCLFLSYQGKSKVRGNLFLYKLAVISWKNVFNSFIYRAVFFNEFKITEEQYDFRKKSDKMIFAKQFFEKTKKKKRVLSGVHKPKVCRGDNLKLIRLAETLESGKTLIF